MITIQIFLINFIIIYIFNLFLFLGSYGLFGVTLIVVGSVIVMIAMNGLIAIICCKILPDSWFSDKFRIYRTSKKECRFYEKIGIKHWKDKTAELGSLNGFRKNKLAKPEEPEYIKRFILETNKGFLTHFISLFISFLAIFLLPSKFWLPLGLPIALTSFVLNLIPVTILRYNMPRLQVMLKYSERKQNKENNNN